jgi:AraC-like DNA-binding protein/ligand-binding sensor protein
MLQELMLCFEGQSGMRMSFEDLTGCMNGAHQDVPAMNLDIAHQLHTCDFCELAKSAHKGRYCIQNKLAVDRLVIRRRTGLEGICHLGLFDLAEPLIHQGRVLGIFYYGSVILRGTEPEVRSRIERHCARRKLDSRPYLEALAKVPVIDPSSLPAHRQTLKTIARVARFLYQTGGVRPELYKFRPLKFPYVDSENLPHVVRETLRYITAHLDEPFIVKDLAAHLNCHPDFLSRKFKQHVGVDLSLYVQEARIERAKLLLENPKLSIEDVAEASGFSDRIHFSKVFRRLAGMPPGEFRSQQMQHPQKKSAC